MNKVQEFVGRRLGELWIIAWGLTFASAAGLVIWWWG